MDAMTFDDLPDTKPVRRAIPEKKKKELLTHEQVKEMTKHDKLRTPAPDFVGLTRGEKLAGTEKQAFAGIEGHKIAQSPGKTLTFDDVPHAQNEPGTLENLGAGIKRGWDATRTGVAQAGLHAGSVLGLIDDGTLATSDQIIREEDKAYQDKYGKSKVALAGNIGSSIATTLPLMAIPGGQASLLARTGASAAQGAAASMMQPVTEENYAVGKAKQGAVGATLGAVVPTAIEGVKAVGSKVGGGVKAVGSEMASRVGKKSAPIIRERADDVLQSTLETRVPVDMGADVPAVFSKKTSVPVSPEVKALIDQGKLTTEQALRAADFRKAGVTPTLGQLTKDFDQTQFEQSMLGNALEGEPIRQAAHKSNREITQAAERLRGGTGATTKTRYETGKSVSDAVSSKLDEAQIAIGKQYKSVTSAVSNKPVIKTDQVNRLSAEVLDDAYSKPFADSVANRLQSISKGEPLTPLQAENMRKYIGQLGNAVDPNIRRLRREFINALDSDVETHAGTDAFKAARAAAAARFKELDNPAVKALYDGMPAEDVVQKHILTGKIDDIAGLKKTLMSGSKEQIERGTKSWNNVRGEVVASIIKKAQNSVTPNAVGDTVFSGANFIKAMRDIPPEKLNLLFNRQERDYLAALGRVAEYRIPPVGSTNPSGTANALINHMARIAGSAAGIPGIGWLLGLRKMALEGAERAQNAVKVQDAISPLSALKSRAVDAPKRSLIPSTGSRLMGLATATEAGRQY